MSHHNIGILLAFASIVTTCTSLPDYHKKMSPTQLQSVFHVDSVDAVPHYEVIQLLHHSFDDGLATAPLPEHYRRRRRRSINSVGSDDTNAERQTTLKQSHHVKKDLSKNPYYSKLKEAANEPGAGGKNSLEPATKQRGHIVGDIRELNEHNVSLNAFGENLNLTLKRIDGLFKGGSPHTLRMWTVREEANATHGLAMEEVFDEDAQSSDEIGEVYQDEANMAAILMRRHLETGDLIMEGSIGHEMVIKPLPHELSPNPDAAHHVIYKRGAQPLEHLSDFAFMEPDDLATSVKLERLQQHRQRRSAPHDEDDEAALELLDDELEHSSAEATFGREKRQAPYKIYPEVLVIIDYDGYRLHGGDNLQVKRYFISFWNGVDLRYRLLKGPKIRISIAGIIISRGRDATPYLERNRVGRDAIDSAAALTDMGKYLFRERRLPVYDIAVAITKYDMCRRRKGGRCTKGTAGFAYVGGACVVNKRLEKVNSVAIIEDTGGFSGIIVAAHEVGHLLGAVHDGSPPPSYLGGPGAQRCRWEDGYIMSDLRHTERGFRWSPCTVQSFHHFLNGDTATCLHNAPHEDSALGRALPGTLLSLDAQCRRDRGTYACFKDERVCAQLFCFDAQTGYCVAYRPAAEGSTCGNQLQCLDGRCRPNTSNGIPPHRSHNSEEEDDDADDDEQIDNEDKENITNGEEESEINPNHIVTKTMNNSNTYTSIHNDNDNNNNNNNQRQVQHSTFEFLARYLAQNTQWQELLGQALLQANAVSGDVAKNAVNIALSDIAVQHQNQQQQQQQQTEQNKFSEDTDVVKTSVSSSDSSSLGYDGTAALNRNLGSWDSNSSSVIGSIDEQHITKDVEKYNARKGDSIEANKNSNTETTTNKIIGQVTKASEIETKEKLILNQNQAETEIETHFPTLHKLTPIQQIQQTPIIATKPTPPKRKPKTTQKPNNLFHYYTHELGKQLQYYLGLLRAPATSDSLSAGDNSSARTSVVSSSSSSSGNRNSDSSNDNNRITINSRRRFHTMIDKLKAPNKTNNSNYSNIVSAAAKYQQQPQTTQLHNNEEQNDDVDIDDDTEDNEDNIDDINVDVDVDVDDASNEAIDDKQQKRKFNTATISTATTTTTTSSVNAQQEQHQQHAQLQQQKPPQSAPTRNSSSSSKNNNSSNNKNNNINNYKGLQRPGTFIDAYLKKLQALNHPGDATGTNIQTTSSVVQNDDKITVGGTHESEIEKRQQAETFDSRFLKRTLNSNNRNSAGNTSNGSSSSSGSSSSANSRSNNRDDTEVDYKSNGSNNKNNNNTNQPNRYHKKLLRKQHAHDIEQQQQQQQHVSSGDELRHFATTTQEPAYVTNYIVDNTQSLPRLLDQQQEPQQQQEQHSSLTKTTITTATTSSTQSQNVQQQSSQQKAHKYKTQKLIRRQLLRTQIK